MCLALGAILGLAGCGLPAEERTEVVADAAVPYNLLGTGESSSRAVGGTANAPRDVPLVFWLGRDDLLTPAAVDLSCDLPAADVVSELLETLAASPSDAEREAGLASALPPAARLALVEVDDGTAEVELDPLAIGDAERLPLVVGQVVLSVTSAPGVDAVRLVTSGETVELPLPGGELVSGSATAEDYASLLPDRVAASGSAELGCRAPGT
ncbi:hypothetical protein J2X46_001583 [Nocardioides sp. BE266]|uniref:GerMN domain-containing protein n=1 Tax=Nocardioides sp. BE266 TaxID=2817725 RepID=UPI002859EA30|nr:GerMN domain-containing protein [Nocardioides sp. BE266]MDR7252607.1 hypothetical protein [Nocardioides sp. BE266]